MTLSIAFFDLYVCMSSYSHAHMMCQSKMLRKTNSILTKNVEFKIIRWNSNEDGFKNNYSYPKICQNNEIIDMIWLDVSKKNHICK